MSAGKSEIETIEDKIKNAAKNAAKDVEDFADKVTADEEPNVVVNADEIKQADKPKSDK